MRKSPCRVRSWTCIHVISINMLAPSMSFTNGKEQEGHRHDAEPCFTCIGHCISRRNTVSHLIQNDVRHAIQLHGTCQTPQENPCCAEKQAGSPASARQAS